MHRKQYSAAQMRSAAGFLLRSTAEELEAALDAIRTGHPAGTDPERAALAIMAAGCPGLFDMLEQLKAKKERGRLRKWRRNGRRDQIRGTP